MMVMGTLDMVDVDFDSWGLAEQAEAQGLCPGLSHIAIKSDQARDLDELMSPPNNCFPDYRVVRRLRIEVI